MTIIDQQLTVATTAKRAAPGPVKDAVVRAMRLEAEGVLSIEIEPADGGAWPDWRAGAHLDVVLGPGLVRQYSLCSRPGEPWRVAVLREPVSRGGSEFVHTALRPGAAIGIRGPRNNFALAPADSYRFLAGGIGITPILAMVRDAEARGVPWTLDYLGRSRTSMAFQKELCEFGNKVRIHADDTDGLFDLAPHLDAPEDGGLAYACGPGGLLGVLLRAADTWRDPLLLQVERFVADPATVVPAPALSDQRIDGSMAENVATADTAATADTGATTGEGMEGDVGEAGDAVDVVDVVDAGDAQSFTVELNDGTEIEVPANQSILQALELHGYVPLNSCREGICGTCETGVVSGEVDHRDSLLSDDEKAASETMMICVSRACGGCPLKLDL